MRGHIAKKGNRYYAVIYEGPDPSSGKAHHRWHAAGGTRKDAERLLADLVKKSHDGDYRTPDRITLGQYLQDKWLPAKKAQLRASTFDSYRRNIELHVVPAIGAVPPSEALARASRHLLRRAAHVGPAQRQGRWPER